MRKFSNRSNFVRQTAYLHKEKPAQKRPPNSPRFYHFESWRVYPFKDR